MSDGLDKTDVGFQYVPQNVFRIAGGADSEHFHLRALIFHLFAQGLELFNGVLNWIAVGELVGLAQNVARLRQQYGLGGSGTSIDADEAPDGCSLLECGWRELLAAVLHFERVKLVL